MAGVLLPEMPDLDDHVMRHVFGPLSRYGVPTPAMPLEAKVRLMKLAAAIAAGDGSLSDSELACLLGQACAYGIPPSVVEQFAKADPQTLRVERLFDAQLRPWAAVALHEAVRIARVDDFGAAERVAAQRAARAMGLEDDLVLAIEGIVGVDAALRDARHALVAPEATPPAPSFDFAAHYRREFFGVAREIPPETAVRAGHAILAVAAADGELSDAEWAWFLGLMRALGAPRDVLRAMVEGERAPDANVPQHARAVLDGAIRVARVDGFDDAERARAEQAAVDLGIDARLVAAFEGIHQLEDALRNARMRLLAGLT